MKKRNLLKRCQYGPCQELFGQRWQESAAKFEHRRYCSIDRQEAANRLVKKERRPPATVQRNVNHAPANNVRELLGPDHPIYPDWTPRPKPKPLMSDREQERIQRETWARIVARAEQPLTVDVCRRLGVAV